MISLHLPLAQGTYHLLNAEMVSRMKAGAYPVNTNCGKPVDSAAVIQTLKSGHLGGVALDVYEGGGVFRGSLGDRAPGRCAVPLAVRDVETPF